MRTRFTSSRVLTILALSLTAVFLMSASGEAGPKGLDPDAGQELRDAGVDKYLGQFTPVASTDVGDGWTKHTFDPDEGNGPICIAGTAYSVFTRAGKKNKLLIFTQGGGACWQDFYNCNVLSEAQEPPLRDDEGNIVRVGIWDFDNPDNIFADYSIVYMPYCDGSTFGGDNDVFDPAFGAAIGVPAAVVRFHRGLRNLSAGMDLAKATFPRASKITVAGSSAGGVGAAAFAPFLARFEYGNNKELTVFNDAGPIAVNLLDVGAVAARAADWQFGQFYPESCKMDMDFPCADDGQQTAIINWRLDNDSTIRESFYETDADLTNRFFTSSPTQLFYREWVVLPNHDPLHDDYPDRYKRFIVTADTSHTALQSPLFYSQTANGVLLNEWTRDFVQQEDGDSQGGDVWDDIVEDFVCIDAVCPPIP